MIIVIYQINEDQDIIANCWLECGETNAHMHQFEEICENQLRSIHIYKY